MTHSLDESSIQIHIVYTTVRAYIGSCALTTVPNAFIEYAQVCTCALRAALLSANSSSLSSSVQQTNRR